MRGEYPDLKQTFMGQIQPANQSHCYPERLQKLILKIVHRTQYRFIKSRTNQACLG